MALRVTLLRIAALLTAGCLPLLARPAAAAAPVLASPDDVARAVLQANPELAAIEERVSALEHGVPQAGTWSDPMASVEYSNVPLSAPYPGGHPMAGIQFRLQQTFPFPGKTGARTAVAASRVATGRDELAERRVQLAGMVRDLYHQLALTRQLKAVTERHIALVTELSDAVRARPLALALADSPMPHDCTKKCDCVQSAKGSSTPTAQEPSDWVKSIWSSP